MTDADRAELRAWARGHAPAGSRMARLVVLLLAERDVLDSALRAQSRLSLALAERVAAQSELLGRRACRAETEPPAVELCRLADDGCPNLTEIGA